MSKRILKGTVVSNKMDKSVVVEVKMAKKHQKYEKRYLLHKKVAVHDEKNKLKVGDKVVIEESRPISKTKHWIVKEVLS